MTALGYHDVSFLAGGIDAWAVAGYEIFKGVNVPSHDRYQGNERAMREYLLWKKTTQRAIHNKSF
jgi:3-mercaptopyruvate sulfurtransferase SseA